MGRVSFAIAEAALEAGAALAAGRAGRRDRPRRGGGARVGRADPRAAVLCNADPKRTLAMLEAGEAESRPPTASGSRPGTSLAGGEAERRADRLPTFSRRRRSRSPAGDGHDHRRRRRRPGRVDAARRGDPAIGFCELYFQTAYDETVAPPGKHVMSVFASTCPTSSPRATGSRAATRSPDWSSTRSRSTRRTFASASRSCRCSARPTSRSGSGSPAATSSRARRCPSRCGTGGSSRALPIDGLYLCGAATHPGGSVIALNGRIAAEAVLAGDRELTGLGRRSH